MLPIFLAVVLFGIGTYYNQITEDKLKIKNNLNVYNNKLIEDKLEKKKKSKKKILERNFENLLDDKTKEIYEKRKIKENIPSQKKKIIEVDDSEIMEYKPEKKKTVTSSLTGSELDIKDFITSNTISKNNTQQNFSKTWAVPFIRKGSQPMKEDSYKNKLGLFTGKQEYNFHKKETTKFFKPSKDVSFVNGKPVDDEKIKGRYIKSNNRRNELPFEAETVGRGIGQNYGSKGKGGFHQFETNEIIKPKNIDELRVLSKPKITYKQPVLSGKDISKRQILPNVNKHRPSKVFKNDSSRYLKTTGAYTKQKLNPEILLKTTTRTISDEQYGSAGPATYVRPTLKKQVKKTNKNLYKNSGKRNLSYSNKWSALESNPEIMEQFQSEVTLNSNNKAKLKSIADYGKSGMKFPPNERDVTQKRSHLSNFNSIIKSVVAPIQDKIKGTKRESIEANPNKNGYISMSMPNKMTTYDPDNVARTTIKETNIHNDRDGNISGNKKQTTYDPDDVTRTTIKETNIYNEHEGNITGNNKQTTYDPDDIARTTIKETNIHNDRDGNMTGNNRQTVYDPNDIARTTIKETNIYNQHNTTTIKGATKVYVYDPNDVARTTIKETNIHNTREGNISIDSFKKPENYNVSPPKKTIKETTIDNKHSSNITLNTSTGSGYLSSNFYAPATTKQETYNENYSGAIGSKQNNRGGYLSNNIEAPATIKQFTSDNDYTGSASSISKLSSSYDSAYNAITNSNKEKISVGRTPTNNGNKVNIGKESINILNKKQGVNINYQNSQNLSNSNTNIYTSNMITVSSQKTPLANTGLTERTENYNLSQLDNNPYHLSINRNIVNEIENFVSEVSDSDNSNYESENENDSDMENFISEISDISDSENY